MKFQCQQVCPYNTLSGCKVDEYYGICPLSNSVQLKESPITNADRIRSMSDEELAEFLWYFCPDGDGRWYCEETKCPECVMDWLKQPADHAEVASEVLMRPNGEEDA